MFIDKVTIKVTAGRGGDGKLSFRHLKSHKGGPDGGDGGRGGNIVIRADHNSSSLYKYRSAKVYQAEDGEMGGTNRRHGKTAPDLILVVPPGTQVIENNTIVKDLLAADSYVVAKGGDGGYGNAHFVSSTRQAPRFAELGEAGEQKEITLELKLIADVGLVGLPNAGKSTLLGAISNAKPHVADYAFTTLIPNLGMVTIDNESVLFADIPGLIEGASIGKGLGDEFLRHVERTKVLLHLVDASSTTIEDDFAIVTKELVDYSKKLGAKRRIVVLTKSDLTDQTQVDAAVAFFEKLNYKKCTTLFVISAATRDGVAELLYGVVQLLRKKVARKPTQETMPVITLSDADIDRHWTVRCNEDVYEVTGVELEKLARRTNFDQVEAVERLRKILRARGVMREIIKQGGDASSKISINGRIIR